MSGTSHHVHRVSYTVYKDRIDFRGWVWNNLSEMRRGKKMDRSIESQFSCTFLALLPLCAKKVETVLS